MAKKKKVKELDDFEVNYKEVKHSEKLIKTLFPSIKMLKHWNKYSIMFDKTSTRYVIVRKPNFWYKLKTTCLLPFIFLPYCFLYGFYEVRIAILQCYKGRFTVAQGLEEDIYNKIKDYNTNANK